MDMDSQILDKIEFSRLSNPSRSYDASAIIQSRSTHNACGGQPASPHINDRESQPKESYHSTHAPGTDLL